MDKQDFLEAFENAMTVGELITLLKRFDENEIVVNTRGREYFPVRKVKQTNIDYCFDEVITKKVVSIW